MLYPSWARNIYFPFPSCGPDYCALGGKDSLLGGAGSECRSYKAGAAADSVHDPFDGPEKIVSSTLYVYFLLWFIYDILCVVFAPSYILVCTRYFYY